MGRARTGERDAGDGGAQNGACAGAERRDLVESRAIRRRCDGECETWDEKEGREEGREVREEREEREREE